MNLNTFTDFFYWVIETVLVSLKSVHEVLWDTSIFDFLELVSGAWGGPSFIYEWIEALFTDFLFYPSIGMFLIGGSFFILVAYKVVRFFLSLFLG